MSSFEILIADDDEAILRLFKDSFAKYKDVQLNIATSGIMALTMVQEKRFDCIITDLRLPGAHGMQIVSSAKEKVNRSTPVYIVSGFIDDSTLAIAQNLGVAETIKKPFDPNALTAKIYNAITQNAAKPAKYDARIINFFIEGAIEIFEYYFKVKPKIGAPMAKNTDEPGRGNVSGVITITGSGFTGLMALNTDVLFVKGLMPYLFPGQDITLTRELVMDILGELCNQIIGKVKIAFVKSGQNATIGLPTVITGKRHSLYHKTKNPVIMLPITIDRYNCDLEFCFSVNNVTLEDQQHDEKVVEDMIFFD